MNRREWMRVLLGLVAYTGTCSLSRTAQHPPLHRAESRPEFAQVIPGRTLRFPEDEGSHPEFRTEWWYVTGWLDARPSPLGFQITFFRARPHPEDGNPSRFAPRHILIAHAAVSDPAHGRLRHEQRSARAGFGLAEAKSGKTDVWIDDWSLGADAFGYAASISGKDFALALRFEPTQPPLLQGDNGYSRKGPHPQSASYYYSLPQLTAHGKLRIAAKTADVTGNAWLDHEWSSQYMDQDAVGWDWAGINLDDGSVLMAFRMRRRDGSSHWASATVRTLDGTTHSYAREAISWQTQRRWTSPRTGATYPIATQVRVGKMQLDLFPLIDDQESDSRLTTGAIYWEGAVTALSHGKRVGRGYLELTGYAKPLSF